MKRIKMGLLAIFVVVSLTLSCSGALMSCGSPMAEAYGGVCHGP